MEIKIRKATGNDFEKVYPLFEQLWPNKELDKNALRIVFKGLMRLELDSGFHREKAHEFYLKLGFE